MHPNTIEKITPLPFFISKKKHISDLKEKLLKIYNSKNKNKLSADKARLWKLNSGNNLDDLKNYLTGKKKE